MTTITFSKQTRAAGRLLMGLAIAILIASASAAANGGHQDRAPAPTRQPVPDNDSVSPAARKSYEDFWNRLPKSKADALERELNALEARQRRGIAVERDVERLYREYSELKGLGDQLTQVQWTVSSGGVTRKATCIGLGWIGRNGRLRCLGKLTT
jgi:hypothetical protein